MAGGFSAGAITAKLSLDKSQFSASIKSVKDDTKTLSSRIQANSAQFKKYGMAMTVAGGAIVGAMALIIKKASEAEETTAKFGTIFAEVFPQASSAVDELTDSYGLSNLAAKTMLAATGDLLTGLGTQSDVALDLSLKTQKLSVDLASFTNFSGGAKGASEALTKAMLGERESIKSLGIVVTEEMVKEELLRMGKESLTGQALLQAKAYATLIIATNQSKFAVGDYERTSGSFANTMRELRARLEDVIVQLGAHLIPIVTKLATGLKEVITKVSDWIKEHPKLTGLIIKFTAGIGALMLIFGPLLMVLPSLTKGFVILKGAILKVIPSMTMLKGSIVGVGGALKAIVPVAAAAFIGWKIGRLIGELTGLDGVVQNLTARVLGLGKITDYELTPALMGEAEAMQELHRLFVGHDKSLTLLKIKYGSYNAALKAAKEGLEGKTTATEVAGKAMSDWGALMKKHGVLTVSEVSDKIGALKQKQDDLKSAYDAGVIGLIAYKKGTKEAADEIKALKGITEEATEATETWGDYLQTLGIKTIPEKERRVDLLKSHLEKLHKEYKDGKIDLEDYEKATKAAKDEIKELSTTITTTAMPAARNMAGVLDQAVGEIEGRVPDITAAIETEVVNISTAWDALTSDLAMSFGNFTDSLLTKGSDLGDALSGLWGDIKDSFKNMIVGMVADWVKGMLVDIVSKSAQAAGGISSALSGIGSAMSGIAAGVATLITTLATAIATAATTLAAAAPAIAVVLAMVIATIFALKAISALFAKKAETSMMEQILKDISHIQLAAALDKMDTTNFFLSEMFPKIDYTNSILAKIENICAKIRDNTKGIFSALTKKGTIYVDVFRSAVIEKLDVGIKESLKETNKAEAIKEKIAILDASINAAMKELQEKLKTAEGEERKKLEEAIARIGLKAQTQRKEFLKQLEAIEKTQQDAVVKTGGFFDTLSNKITGGLGKLGSNFSDAKDGIPSAQFGAVLTQPGLVETHGTPSNPEIIMRQSDLLNIPRAKGAVNVNLSVRNEFAFNNQVDPNFTQNYVRNIVIPEMYRGLQTSARVTKLKEILGV